MNGGAIHLNTAQKDIILMARKWKGMGIEMLSLHLGMSVKHPVRYIQEKPQTQERKMGYMCAFMND